VAHRPGRPAVVTFDAEREVADAEVAEALGEAGAYALV